MKVPFFSYFFGFLLILRPEVIQGVPGTPTDMPKAPQTQSIGVIFVALGCQNGTLHASTAPFSGLFSHRLFDLHFERFFKVFGIKFGFFFHVCSPSLHHVFKQNFTCIFIGLLIAFRRDSFQATRILLHEYSGLRTVTSCRDLYFRRERPQIRTSFLTLI